MKKFNTFIILFLVTNTLVFAQSREIYPQQVSIEHNQAVQRFSSDYVTMQSSSSESMAENAGDAVNIASLSVIGIQNLFNLSQTGESNTFLLDVDGNNNEGNFEQKGYDNLININLIGNNNNLGVMQHGNSNVYESTFETNNQSLGTVTQNGDFQNAQIIGQNGIPLSISQTGSGASIIIRNN